MSRYGKVMILTVAFLFAACSATTDVGEIDYAGVDAGDDDTGGGDRDDADVGEPIEGCVDQDRDGIPAGAACPGITDCDDGNPDRNQLAIEVCDGVDNDCDGATDEDVSSPTCALTLGVCTGSHKACTGEGFAACTEESYGSDYMEVEDEEACDGLDNDCDGLVDEECPCDEGDVRACGTDEGTCQRGTQRCSGGRWGHCQGAISPVDEVCDGLDNNCDGEVDNNLEDAAPSCRLTVGVCSGARRHCGGQEGWVPCTAESYGALYVAEEGPATDTCNGADDDCDGETDEGCVCLDGQTEVCGTDVGACSSGVKRCEAGVFGACEGAQGPVEEVCDGADNDCDGLTDEDCPCSGDESRVCYTDVGECEQGHQTCDNGVWGPCSGRGPTEEVCDGRDNNCNGTTDEGLQNACGGCGVLQGTPGSPCGACGAGSWTCEEGAVVCEGGDGSVLNACGGCNTLPNEPGTACGTCDSGRWVCADESSVRCDGDRGSEALNGCGTCTTLAHEPGEPCGPCDTGEYVCRNVGPTVNTMCSVQNVAVPSGWVLVCPDTFTLGSGNTDAHADSDEQPAHEVTLTHALLVKTHEARQSEWSAVAERLGQSKEFYNPCPTCPANNVSFFEVVLFANALSAQDGFTPCYELTGCVTTDLTGNGCPQPDGGACAGSLICSSVGLLRTCTGYRLPTEAEWEFLTRAGTTTPWFQNNVELLDECNATNLGLTTNYCGSGLQPPRPRGTGELMANPWGLFDMSGNVAEWVQDRFGSYSSAAQTDPVGPLSGGTRVIRGGAWDSGAAECRSAARDQASPETLSGRVGFRLVRSIGRVNALAVGR